MKWVSVNEFLPKNDDDVMVYNPKDGITIGYYDADEVHAYIDDDGSTRYIDDGWNANYAWAQSMLTTHWMELPEFPEENVLD